MYALWVHVYYHYVSYSLYLLVLYRCKWVRVDGITYKLNCAVVCGITDEEPTFAKIKNIYIMDCYQVVFELQKLNNKGLTNIFVYLLWSVLAHIPSLF